MAEGVAFKVDRASIAQLQGICHLFSDYLRGVQERSRDGDVWLNLRPFTNDGVNTSVVSLDDNAFCLRVDADEDAQRDVAAAFFRWAASSLEVR